MVHERHIRPADRAVLASVLIHAMTGEVHDRMDAIARLTARALRAPVSLVSIIGADDQHLAGAVGLPDPLQDSRSMPLRNSMCRHVVAAQGELLVEDAREDAALREDPAVRELGVVAYAGTPLRAGDGTVIGSVCAIDGRPRAWRQEEVAALRDAAALAGAELVLLQAAAPGPGAERRSDPTADADQETVGALLAMTRLAHDLRQSAAGSDEVHRHQIRSLVHEVTTLLAVARMACEDFDDDRPIAPAARVEEIAGCVAEALRVLHGHVERRDRPVSVAVRAEPVETAALLGSVRTMMAPLCAPGVELEVGPPPASVATIRTDPVLVGQVLRNLVGNALRLTTEGRVVLAAARDGNTVRITVGDTGPGVPEADAERIFESGQSGESAGRFGLGLPLARGLMATLGGDVRLVENSPAGAVFEATLREP